MRPCGPLPVTPARSMPFSAAIRLASGEANTRSPAAFARLPFALSLSKGVPALRRREVLRQAQHERVRGLVLARELVRAPHLAAGLHACRILALFGQRGDHRADLHPLGPFGHRDVRDGAFVDRFELHRRLVGLDLGHDVAGGDLVAHLHQPFGERALLHRRRQGGHLDGDRHGRARILSGVAGCAGLWRICGAIKLAGKVLAPRRLSADIRARGTPAMRVYLVIIDETEEAPWRCASPRAARPTPRARCTSWRSSPSRSSTPSPACRRRWRRKLATAPK